MILSRTMSDGMRKAPSSQNNPNHDMCQFLMELSAYERTVSRNIFKSNAYKAAASALAAHPSRVTSGKEASSIKGIGKKIAEKIDEFLSTGKLKKLEKIRGDDMSIALTELTRVTGVGPAKARQLYDAGITTLTALQQNKDLLTHHQKIGLRYVEEFEKRIPRAEVRAIEVSMNQSLRKLKSAEYSMTVCGSYRRGSEKSGDVDVLITYKERDTNTPIKEEAETENTMTSVSLRSDLSDRSSDDEPPSKKVKLATCSAGGSKGGGGGGNKIEGGGEKKDRGDNKRGSGGGNKLVGGRDNKGGSGGTSNQATLVTEPPKGGVIKSRHRQMLQEVVSQLTEDGLVTETLSLGDSKFMGVCLLSADSCHRRLDIRLLPPQNYHCGVLYFTGSDIFNKEMRSVALAAGFTLNEYSIRPVGSTGVAGEPLPVSSEEDVFDYLDLRYKTPSERSVLL